MDAMVVDLVNQKDDLQIAIRCHLVIEHFLIKIIEEKLCSPEDFNTDRLSFRQKVELAIALGGLNKEKKGILIYINKLRNKYAHDMDYHVSDSEIDEMYYIIGTNGQSALSKTSYGQMDNIGKLGGIFLVLYAYLSKFK